MTKSPGDRYGRAGHLCQDRHKNEAVEDDAYLLTVVRYIHRNSVKAGLCREPEDYRYSSFAQYVRAYLKRAPLLCRKRRLRYSVFRPTGRSIQSAPLGQFLTHSIQRIHSVPFFLFLELSVTSTFIGHTLLHLPQEIHFSLSHVTRRRAK